MLNTRDYHESIGLYQIQNFVRSFVAALISGLLIFRIDSCAIRFRKLNGLFLVSEIVLTCAIHSKI